MALASPAATNASAGSSPAGSIGVRRASNSPSCTPRGRRLTRRWRGRSLRNNSVAGPASSGATARQPRRTGELRLRSPISNRSGPVTCSTSAAAAGEAAPRERTPPQSSGAMVRTRARTAPHKERAAWGQAVWGRAAGRGERRERGLRVCDRSWGRNGGRWRWFPRRRCTGGWYRWPVPDGWAARPSGHCWPRGAPSGSSFRCAAPPPR